MAHLESLVILDPSPRSRSALTFGFERAGFSVYATGEGGDALAMSQTKVAQLVIASISATDEDEGRDTLTMVGRLREADATSELPIVVLGERGARESALRAGADEFVARPAFIRDVLTLAKLAVALRQDGDDSGVSGLLEDYGLYFLTRALAVAGRTGVVELERERRQGEVWFVQGEVVAARCGRQSGVNAFNHLLLWGEAQMTLRFESPTGERKISQPIDQLLSSGARFAREFEAYAARIGGAQAVYRQEPRKAAEQRAQIPPQVMGLLKHFDGQRPFIDVVEDGPFKALDTIKITWRLSELGVLERVNDAEEEAPLTAQLAVRDWLLGSGDQEGTDRSTVTEAGRRAAEAYAAEEARRATEPSPGDDLLDDTQKVRTAAARADGAPAMSVEDAPTAPRESERGPTAKNKKRGKPPRGRGDTEPTPKVELAPSQPDFSSVVVDADETIPFTKLPFDVVEAARVELKPPPKDQAARERERSLALERERAAAAERTAAVERKVQAERERQERERAVAAERAATVERERQERERAAAAEREKQEREHAAAVERQAQERKAQGERERHERERVVAAERAAAEKERLEAERKSAAERAAAAEAAERLARDLGAAAEKERLDEERAERERVAAEKVERERIAAEKVERERVAAEKVERERVAAERAERERAVAAERAATAEKDRGAAVRAVAAERERLAAERASASDLERAVAEKDRAAVAEKDRAAAAERTAAERAERERVAAERAERERVAAERAERERVVAERAERERVAAERAERERVVAERAAAERAERERVAAAERVAAERAERERAAAERAEAEAEKKHASEGLEAELERAAESHHRTSPKPKLTEPKPAAPKNAASAKAQPNPKQQGKPGQKPQAKPQQPGAKPQQPGAKPQQPGAGARPQQPGARPQQPGARPQQPGARPAQPAGAKPAAPGAAAKSRPASGRPDRRDPTLPFIKDAWSDLEEEFFAGADDLSKIQPVETFDDLEPAPQPKRRWFNFGGSNKFNEPPPKSPKKR